MSNDKKEPTNVRERVVDVTAPVASAIASPLAGALVSGLSAPDGYGWSHGLRTWGGGTLGGLLGMAPGVMLNSPALAQIGLRGGWAGGSHLGHQNARKRMREAEESEAGDKTASEYARGQAAAFAAFNLSR